MIQVWFKWIKLFVGGMLLCIYRKYKSQVLFSSLKSIELIEYSLIGGVGVLETVLSSDIGLGSNMICNMLANISHAVSLVSTHIQVDVAIILNSSDLDFIA